MKNIKTPALALAVLVLTGASYGQTTPMTTPFTSASISDNPGSLGHTYGDLNFSWVDFSEDGIDADGFIANLKGNTPVARGIDVGLGYSYYRENGHRNPFDNSEFDPRYHQLATNATFYTPTGTTKAFLSGGIMYQWSQGDIQRLRTYDDQWFFAVSGGAEIGLGTVAITPRITYTDTFDDVNLGTWHYGAELHTWFNESIGGYLDATYHDPRRSRNRPESWTYTAGLRFRY